MGAIGRFPASHNVLQRLRVSEGQRRRHGTLACQPERLPGPIAAVRHLVCQYIPGDPQRPGWAFCGAPTLAGKSWCAKHDAVVFIPPFMAGDDP